LISQGKSNFQYDRNLLCEFTTELSVQKTQILSGSVFFVIDC